MSVFSPPDQEILELSNHAAYICHHGGTDAFTVVDAKAITEVVLMVPDFQVAANGDIIVPENRFSLVEVPFIKLAKLCSVVEDDNDDNDDTIDFVE